MTPKFLFQSPNLQAHGTSVSKGGTAHSINAGTMEASASISDACSTIDIFKAAICALMQSNEYVQGGFTFGKTRQSTAVPPSCSTSSHVGRLVSQWLWRHCAMHSICHGGLKTNYLSQFMSVLSVKKYDQNTFVMLIIQTIQSSVKHACTAVAARQEFKKTKVTSSN